jgi:hypothetical protein
MPGANQRVFAQAFLGTGYAGVWITFFLHGLLFAMRTFLGISHGLTGKRDMVTDQSNAIAGLRT